MAGLVDSYGPSSSTRHSRPSRGAKPRGADDARPAQERPRQAGSRGAERLRHGRPREAPHDMSHDDRGQVGASACSVSVSSLVLRGQAQARSTEASSKGFPIGATRPRPAGRQDGGHHGSQGGVTTRAFCRRRPPLVRISYTSFPLSNWPLLAPFLLNIWGEDKGLYK